MKHEVCRGSLTTVTGHVLHGRAHCQFCRRHSLIAFDRFNRFIRHADFSKPHAETGKTLMETLLEAFRRGLAFDAAQPRHPIIRGRTVIDDEDEGRIPR